MGNPAGRMANPGGGGCRVARVARAPGPGYSAATRAGAFTKHSSTKPTASTSAIPRIP